MDRSERRYRTEVIHTKRKKYGFKGFSSLETPKRISSCRCCSNPRRTWKGEERLTLQEIKFKDKENG